LRMLRTYKYIEQKRRADIGITIILMKLKWKCIGPMASAKYGNQSTILMIPDILHLWRW